MYKRINVGLRQESYDKLRTKVRFGESFSTLISRLLDEVDRDVLAKGDGIQSS
jgi:predicted CopG family antitoxin